ncbi:MAG: glycosyltransferase [Candidatus Nanoarchaeia archaeon]|nr:glycosyltransferase [Candidatus Nanoarchaeia archaeon]
MGNIVLPNTSLCSIVRDELMNPAGGIKDFIECIVPYVEQAVIVDTGSLDGTREILEELKSIYPNLQIYDRKFDNFADSRNYSLSKIETEKALVLDADERIFSEDIEKLYNFEIKNPDKDFSFYFFYVLPTGEQFGSRDGGHNPRLFKVEGRYYINKKQNFIEQLCNSSREINPKYLFFDFIKIVHFVIDRKSNDKKNKDWYKNVVYKGLDKAPSQIDSFKEWKAFNPYRLNFQ